MKRLVAAMITSWCAIAGANGRPDATSTINFQQGNPNNIAAGMTFGLLLSHDGGATWSWMCEGAVGYGGMYDPDYAYSSSGALFATTFEGLTVLRDGCVFEATPPGMTYASQVELDPNGALYYAASDPADGKIYKSTDDGMTFPISAAPGMSGDSWSSLVIAPSDPMRVYLSGHFSQTVCNSLSPHAGATCSNDLQCKADGPVHADGRGDAKCEKERSFFMFKSIDGGVSYSPLSLTNVVTTVNSDLYIVGVDRTRPDIVYLHVTLDDPKGANDDSIYKSVDGGGTPGDAGAWHKILSGQDPFGFSFIARANGELIAATQTLGAQRSTAGDACMDPASCGWAALANPPHINCLVENPGTLATTGEVWACTHNNDTPLIRGDGYGIMKTTDFATWTPVLRYQDIQDIVHCPAGTAQQDQCIEPYMGHLSVWCCLEAQLGITSTTVDCTGALACSMTDLRDTTIGVKPPTTPGGCCETGGSGAGALLIGLGTCALLLRRRRRVSTGQDAGDRTCSRRRRRGVTL